MPKKKTRPDVVDSRTHRLRTQCGTVYFIAGYEKNKLCEITIQVGKSGCCQRGLTEAVSKVTTRILTYEDVDDKEVMDTFMDLVSISCLTPFYYKGEQYKSCMDCIGQIIVKELKDEREKEKAKEKEANKEKNAT